MASLMQLTFQAGLDPYHAMFRLLRLLPIIRSRGPLYRDHVRILDFYLIFPFRIDEIRLNPKHRKYKRLAADYSSSRPYGDIPDSVVMFDRMAPIQVAGMQTVVSSGYLNANSYDSGFLASTDVMPQGELLSRVSELNSAQADLVAFLDVLAAEYLLAGPNGLKSRTGLLEYRYDPI